MDALPVPGTGCFMDCRPIHVLPSREQSVRHSPIRWTLLERMITRRDFLRVALAAPAGAWMANYRALAAPFEGQVRITAIKAMQLDFQFDGCLIKVETDAGLVGYGETGTSSSMARAYIDHMAAPATFGGAHHENGQAQLIGADPLPIEKHFYRMAAVQHPYRSLTGTVSGIDIALWDLAGKITGQPVYKLLGPLPRWLSDVFSRQRPERHAR